MTADTSAWLAGLSELEDGQALCIQRVGGEWQVAVWSGAYLDVFPIMGYSSDRSLSLAACRAMRLWREGRVEVPSD